MTSQQMMFKSTINSFQNDTTPRTPIEHRRIPTEAAIKRTIRRNLEHNKNGTMLGANKKTVKMWQTKTVKLKTATTAKPLLLQMLIAIAVICVIVAIVVQPQIASATTEWWGDKRAYMYPTESPPFYDIIYDDNNDGSTPDGGDKGKHETDEVRCQLGIHSNAIPNYVYFGEMISSGPSRNHSQCLHWCLHVTEHQPEQPCQAVNFFLGMFLNEKESGRGTNRNWSRTTGVRPSSQIGEDTNEGRSMEEDRDVGEGVWKLEGKPAKIKIGQEQKSKYKRVGHKINDNVDGKQTDQPLSPRPAKVTVITTMTDGPGFCELLTGDQQDNPRLMRPFRGATYYERIHCRRRALTPKLLLLEAKEQQKTAQKMETQSAQTEQTQPSEEENQQTTKPSNTPDNSTSKQQTHPVEQDQSTITQQKQRSDQDIMITTQVLKEGEEESSTSAEPTYWSTMEIKDTEETQKPSTQQLPKYKGRVRDADSDGIKEVDGGEGSKFELGKKEEEGRNDQRRVTFSKVSTTTVGITTNVGENVDKDGISSTGGEDSDGSKNTNESSVNATTTSTTNRGSGDEDENTSNGNKSNNGNARNNSWWSMPEFRIDQKL